MKFGWHLFCKTSKKKVQEREWARYLRIQYIQPMDKIFL